MRLFLHLAGLDSSNSTTYLFWSGIGSDLTYAGALSLLWHHVNCHEPRCWRVARHTDPSDGYKRCGHHLRKMREAQ